jgi:hypothetical protein
LLAGIGHGLGFLNAQEELNELAPERRRGEVTSAFIASIYFLVASSVIATGVLDVWLSLSLAVGAVSLCLFSIALAAAGWQLGRRYTAESRNSAPPVSGGAPYAKRSTSSSP